MCYNISMTTKQIIEELADGEPLPTSTPYKYKNSRGYVRLRWLVGPRHYVEIYEHRIAAGRPPSNLDVHHINHIKDDNRPENLLVLSRRDHSKLHSSLNREKWDKRRAARGGYRSWRAYEKAQRRIEREKSRHEKYLKMKGLYEEGYSTTEIGKIFGIDNSNVSVHLRQVGTEMRPFKTPPKKMHNEIRPTK